MPGLAPHQVLHEQLAHAPEIISRAAVLLDANTGTLLYIKNAFDEIPPASMTKLMTMHILQNEIYAGRASPDDIIIVPEEGYAINQPPRSSLMFLGPGQTVTLRDLLLGLAVSSGNDAAITAALIFTPAIDKFVSIMNSEAKRLGLQKTTFVEPSGISELNMTCAAEFAYFCRFYLAMHPKSLEYYHSVREFSWPKTDFNSDTLSDIPKTITQNNRNSLLKTFPGTDGLKTGYIDEAGYNIALTAQRNNTRFIAVILGAPAQTGGDNIRDEDGKRLLSWAFRNFKTVYPETVIIEDARLWKGKQNTVKLKPARPDPLVNYNMAFTAPVQRAQALWVSTEILNPLIAPLPMGCPAGYLKISDDQGELHCIQLLTKEASKKGNVFKQIWHSLILLFK
jgi:D-alanyl-D-alanine carboxypeptidase (penicillin-binding protein 5/6)